MCQINDPRIQSPNFDIIQNKGVYVVTLLKFNYIFSVTSFSFFFFFFSFPFSYM